MKLKVLSILIALAMVFVGSICKAEDAFAAKKTFTGTVTPLITQDIAYGFNDGHRGFVDYVAPPGSLFFGPVYDNNGKVLREGTTLIHIDPSYRKAQLAADKALIQKDIVAVEIAKINAERDEKLVKTHSVPEATYLNDKSTYLEAIASLEADKANMEKDQELLAICTLTAEFPGIVNQVYFPFGLCAGELKVMNVSLLNPVGIAIAMDRKTANQINRNTPITVYPTGSSTAFGVYHGTVNLTNDGVIISLDNSLKVPPVDITVDGKQLPIVNNVTSVVEYRPTGYVNHPKNLPMVIAGAICKDDKGEYVWKLQDEMNGVPGKGVNYVAKVQKIYLKTATSNKEPFSYYNAVVIEDTPGIKVGNILIPTAYIPDDLKDGDMICVSTNRYIFMPGDPVTVEIGPNPSQIK